MLKKMSDDNLSVHFQRILLSIYLERLFNWNYIHSLLAFSLESKVPYKFKSKDLYNFRPVSNSSRSFNMSKNSQV